MESGVRVSACRNPAKKHASLMYRHVGVVNAPDTPIGTITAVGCICLGMVTDSLSYSGKKRVRDFEKAALKDAFVKAHEDGAHEEYQQRDCPKCEYDGHYPEKKVE